MGHLYYVTHFRSGKNEIDKKFAEAEAAGEVKEDVDEKN
jgi:hypothetical protein